MLVLCTPAEAYRRVDFDARVAVADASALVALCYEQIISALGSAGFAHENADNHAKSKAITRALAAVTALQIGVTGSDTMADALRQFYQSTRRAMIDNALDFNADQVAGIRRDFTEIAGAIASAGQQTP